MKNESQIQPTDEYKAAFMQAVSNPELLQQYDRLKGKNLFRMAQLMAVDSPEYQVMEQSGVAKQEIDEFVKFFDEFIWSRMNKPKY